MRTFNLFKIVSETYLNIYTCIIYRFNDALSSKEKAFEQFYSFQ